MSWRTSATDNIGHFNIGYFDNTRHDDPAIRKKKHDFMLRNFDTAVLLGVDAICGSWAEIKSAAWTRTSSTSRSSSCR